MCQRKEWNGKDRKRIERWLARRLKRAKGSTMIQDLGFAIGGKKNGIAKAMLIKGYRKRLPLKLL